MQIKIHEKILKSGGYFARSIMVTLQGVIYEQDIMNVLQSERDNFKLFHGLKAFQTNIKTAQRT